MLEQSYTSTPAGSPTQGTGEDKDKTGYWPLSKLKKCYTDYLFNKREEIDEATDARRYYHGTQWTSDQLKALKKRKQPAMTFNRISRKINGTVGLIEKLRQDPKAFARTPQHQQGAELATATLRYILDEQEWKAKSPLVALDGAIDGIGGIEIQIEQGDHGDPEIAFEDVDIQSFFYDPRSFEPDFEDARFKGMGKWVDQDIAEETFPKAEIGDLTGDTDLTTNNDRETRWFSSVGQQKRVRLVDLWYKHKGGWCWAIFTGSAVLMEGKSYLKNEKGKDLCKYIMFSANVDQDGDRYGLIRNMKSAQDGLNAKQSKLQHIIASKRLILSTGAVDDIEKTRAEWARPDGVIVTNRPVNEGVKTDDQSFDFAGLSKLLELNIQEIENFGPNPALEGQGGVENSSGKAIALLQQAGMAELGPYILSYRGWKFRVYRALWNAAQQHWKGERWIRVTDDQNLAQFIQINGTGIDPHTGMPGIINAIGSLDVDIILDEGPDTITAQADFYETLQQIVPSLAPLLSPAKANVMIDALVATSPAPEDIKQQFKKISQAEQNQPPPVPPEIQKAQIDAQVKQQTAQQDAQLQTQKQQSDAALKAQQQQTEAQLEAHKTQQQIELERGKASAQIQIMREKAAAEIEIARAKAEMDAHIRAQQAEHDARIEGFRADNEQHNTERKFKFESEMRRKEVAAAE
jgi:hypothetical protein